jgi:hypothetical protein
LPDRLAVGKVPGFFQPAALFQIWGLATKNEGDPLNTTFRLRRAEFRAKGEIAPKLVSYFLAFDVAKTTPFAAANVNVTGGDGGGGTVRVQQPGADRSVLQDVWITYISEFADVSLGQFKIPVSMEALQSSSRLLFPERSRVSRAYGDRRDVGLRIDKKIGDVFYYQLGLYNGNGQNTTDNDRKKDGGLRLELTPLPGLTIGAVGYATIGGRDQNVRDRLEADLRYDANDVFFQAEYIHAWDGPPDPAMGAPTRIEGHGAHGILGYTIMDRIQPVVRIGILDPNVDAGTAAANSPLRFFEAGLNYMLRGYDARLSLAGAFYSQKRGEDQGEITFQSQVAF